MRLDEAAPDMDGDQGRLAEEEVMEWESIAAAAPAAFLLGIIVGYTFRSYGLRKETAPPPQPPPPTTRKKAP
jgi:hypothetical protein